MAMSGADDWTIEIETRGLPELKHVYSLYGKANLVHARCFPQFKHNYNEVSRELMFDWFNRHLQLELEVPVEQQDFWPVPPAELTVFDEEHPLPADAKSSEDLRDYLTRLSEEQFAALLPNDPAGLEEYRRIVGTAARVMLDEGAPKDAELELTEQKTPLGETLQLHKGLVGRRGSGEQIPYVALVPKDFNGTSILWLDERGKSHLFDESGQPNAAVQSLLDGGYAVASVDVYLTGEFVPEGEEPQYPVVDKTYQGYTYGYNRPVLANRVRDILTAISASVHHKEVRRIRLVGTGAAGLWTLLAAAVAPGSVEGVVVELQNSSFAEIDETSNPMFLPGGLKYGDIGGLAALAAPARLEIVCGDATIAGLKPLIRAYAHSGGSLTIGGGTLTPQRAAAAIAAPDAVAVQTGQ
jgi:hypothetical protein